MPTKSELETLLAKETKDKDALARTLLRFQKKVVAVARREAVANDWCEVVVRALDELGLSSLLPDNHISQVRTRKNDGKWCDWELYADGDLCEGKSLQEAQQDAPGEGDRENIWLDGLDSYINGREFQTRIVVSNGLGRRRPVASTLVTYKAVPPVAAEVTAEGQD